MSDDLLVELYDEPVATLTRLSADDYRLDYTPEWRLASDGLPLSISLPLSAARHRGQLVWNFVDNLLPDNPEVRERWATRAGLATTDPFALITHYGHDVAGAVSFRTPGEPPAGSRIELSDDDVALRIRTAREDAAAWHDDRLVAEGQFSLGGAQTKFSLAHHEGRWFETAGVEPSTHIFKPQVTGVPEGEIVEYVIMSSAAALGIATAGVSLRQFGDEHCLVVERFDRDATHGFPRLHQEDLAQSLGIPRLRKYERDGGPSFEAIARHLAEHGGPYARESKEALARMLAFSWIVLNTDAHTKNYSVLIDDDGALLAPLYDASSLIPYLGPSGLDRESVLDRAAGCRLAMRYGSSYLVGDTGGFELGAVARACGMRSTELVGLAAAYCLALPGIVGDIVSSLPSALQTETVQRLVSWMPLRAGQAASGLKGFLR